MKVKAFFWFWHFWCYMEGVIYLDRCWRCREKQLEDGVVEKDVVYEVYMGESHRSIVARCRSHLDREGGKGGAGASKMEGRGGDE